MMRGTTPSVTRLCAFSRPCTLWTSTAMIAAVRREDHTEAESELDGQAHVAESRHAAGNGDTHSL